MSYFDAALPQPLPQKRITPFHSDTVGLSADIQTLWSQNQAMYAYITELTAYLADQEALRINMEEAIETLQEQVDLLNGIVSP